MTLFPPHVVPLLHLARSATRRAPLSLEEVSDESWTVAAGVTVPRRAAIHLPGQLDRILGLQEDTTFAQEQRRITEGEVQHGATRAHLLKDALLYAGFLYKGLHRRRLVPREARNVVVRIPRVAGRASLGATEYGGRYFAHFLMDDCTLKRGLALDPGTFGEVQSPYRRYSPHERQYLSLLGMSGERFVDGARYDELVVLDDRGQNPFKRERYEWLRGTLFEASGLPPEPPAHPGVFVVRGTGGARRVLENEAAIGEHLARKYGFRVVNPMDMSVREIVRACAGASVAIGVEGSALIHALLLLRPGTSLVCLEPPTRFNNIYKDQADCLDLNYGFVVGLPAGDDFSVPIEDIDRTLELLPG